MPFAGEANGRRTLAYDAPADALYATDQEVVWRFRQVSDPVACEAQIVLGKRGEFGVKLGPPPGRLNNISSISLTPGRDLVLSDDIESVVLRARLPN